MTRVEIFLFAAGLLLSLCVLLSKASGRIGFPTLVVFLGVGILAGSEGLGGIYFDNAYYAQTLGIISLVYILFSGGLDTQWSSVRTVLKSAVSLATLGVFLTCMFVGLFTHYFLNLTLLEGLLVGAIISSTDAGAVFTVLRSKKINFKGPIKPLLELESGSNDPMAVFLVTSLLILISAEDYPLIKLLPRLIQQMLLGGAVGYLGGKVMASGFNRLKLEIEGLYTVLSFSSVLILYASAQAIEGNGYLAVYIAGMVLGNRPFIYRKTITFFHDGLSWLMQSAMFLTLGLLIYPSQVFRVTQDGILVAGFMIFIARPAAVFISLSRSSYSWREKLLVSWIGLRGAVPVVMATYALVAGIAKAEFIFNVVFFVTVTSLLLQGTSISYVAKLLGLYVPQEEVRQDPTEYASPSKFKDSTSYITIPAESDLVSKSIVDLELPKDFLIVLIEREGKVIIPRGATELMARDKLMIISEKESLQKFRSRV